jgi:nucleotide-binding universal stress UspA family protein
MTIVSAVSTEVRLKRILVATDYSPAARLAVSRAGQLARQHEAHLHLVHVQPDWDLFAHSGPAAAEHLQALTKHAEQALKRELAYLEATFGIQARGENRSGRASHVLRSAAAEFEPHLIVAGARGEHDLPNMAPFLGGTALKLIAYSPWPVLIVRSSAVTPYRVSLAAVECSSESARRLVHWAKVLLREGECHVVHAFDVPYVDRMRAHGIPESAINSCNKDVREAASAVIKDVLDEAGDPHCRIHAHLVGGEPVASLLAEIERRQPDVVVLGKHEHPPREHHMRSLGSVALRIAYHAPGDVLVVP